MKTITILTMMTLQALNTTGAQARSMMHPTSPAAARAAFRADAEIQSEIKEIENGGFVAGQVTSVLPILSADGGIAGVNEKGYLVSLELTPMDSLPYPDRLYVNRYVHAVVFLSFGGVKRVSLLNESELLRHIER